MKIELRGVSKRFNYEWIFRGLNFDFESGNSYAIIGQNGSGKSTLLKIISGQLSPSEGAILFNAKKKNYCRKYLCRDCLYRTIH